MNHAPAVSALIGSILDNDHMACLKQRDFILSDQATNNRQQISERVAAALLSTEVATSILTVLLHLLQYGSIQVTMHITGQTVTQLNSQAVQFGP